MAGILAPQHSNEEAARAHLEAVRWPDGPVCPKCGEINNATKLTGRPGSKSPVRTGVWKCRGCKSQFSVTVDSIFSDSKIPLHKWLFALHLMCSSKKGVSAHQLWRNLWEDEEGSQRGSYRTAWFMCHRIRWAMGQEPMRSMLGGEGMVVEADETYIGGREKGKRGVPGPDSKKTPVVSLVERNGDVRSFQVKRVTLENIKPILKENVDPKTHLITDEHTVYLFAEDILPKHSTVNHGKKEYVRREGAFKVTTNTIESYFSLIKRGNYGVYHHWSRKHLMQYLREFDFRYNHRKSSDHERALIALKCTSGKRLMLKTPKAADK